VDGLRARGIKVEVLERVHQPFLRPAGTKLRLNGTGITKPAVIESYNFDEADLGTDATQAAAQDTAQVGPDGQPRTAVVDWVAPPLFFRRERVVVLYVGSEPAVLTLLTDVMGRQFAGS
jgi:hypothetical protein